MMPSYRSNDAVITIYQDNAAREVFVHELNPAAQEALGHRSEKVEKKALTEMVPERIRTLLKEYVEFEDDGNDVGTVLSRVQSFCLLTNSGQEVGYRLKVLRSESLDGNAYFKLILQDRSGGRREEAFRAILRENFKGHEVLDKATQLPDRQSIAKDLELVHYYINKEALTASFATIRLDRYSELCAQHGDAFCADVLKQIAHIIKQNLRADDTIGRIGDQILGLILLDTQSESARMVLNRLRWLIASHGFTTPKKETLAITVSIAFMPMSGALFDKEMLQKVEAQLILLPAATHNALLEVK